MTARRVDDRLQIAGARGFLAWLGVLVGLRLLLTLDFDLLAASSTNEWRFYAGVGQLAAAGRYPYVDYWMEYPPMLAWYAVGLFALAAQVPGVDPVSAFHYLHVGLAVLADLAALGLFYWLAWRLHGPLAATVGGLVYAALLPGYRFAVEGMADSLIVPFLLGGLCLLVAGRPAWAGAVAAFGFGLKLFPGVLLLTAAWGLGRRPLARFGLAFGGVVVALLLPLLALNPVALRTSVQILLGRPSWESVPALLRGYYAWGNLPPLGERQLTAPPDLLSPDRWDIAWSVLTLLVLLVLLVWLSRLRPGDDAPAALVLVTTGVLSVGLALVKGFSPQYVAWVLPLVLLALPGRFGLTLALLLTAALTIELVAPGRPPLLMVAAVVARTLVLAVVAVAVLRRLGRASAPRVQTVYSTGEITSRPAAS